MPGNILAFKPTEQTLLEKLNDFCAREDKPYRTYSDTVEHAAETLRFDREIARQLLKFLREDRLRKNRSQRKLTVPLRVSRVAALEIWENRILEILEDLDEISPER